MQRFSSVSKIFLTIVIASGALWLGSYTVKLFSIYNLFELDQSNTLVLKSFLINLDLKPVIYEFLPVLSISLISYILFLVFSVLFLFSTKINLKQNGWLFISLMIILFCLPFEIYLSIKDYNIINMILNSSEDTASMIELMKSRITELSSYPIISLILHYSVIIFLVFKPLTKKA